MCAIKQRKPHFRRLMELNIWKTQKMLFKQLLYVILHRKRSDQTDTLGLLDLMTTFV